VCNSGHNYAAISECTCTVSCGKVVVVVVMNFYVNELR
jgi:hypothetical protein